MKHRTANYTVVIEKQKRMGTNRECYMAFVPLLGIATESDTLEQVRQAVKSLIRFHLDSLVEEGEKVPIETGDSYITKSEVTLPVRAAIA